MTIDLLLDDLSNCVFAYISDKGPVSVTAIQKHFYLGFAKTEKIVKTLIDADLIVKENGKCVCKKTIQKNN